MRPAVSIRIPAPALLWALVASGHALACGWPMPALLHGPALTAALFLGAASLLFAVLAAPRTPGLRRAPLERWEAALAAAALLAAGAALGAEADASMQPLSVHPRPVRVEVEGRVLDTTALDARPSTILFEVRRVTVGRASAPCRARIALRFRDEAAAPRWAFPGLCLTVSGAFRPPEDARNAGTDAPGRWLERQGIAGTLEADPLHAAAAADPVERGAAATWVWRDRMARAFDAALTAPVAALARGMILGDRSMIAPATRDDFRDGGTIHILSISGLHVCILGGFAALAAAAFRLSLVPSLSFELAAVWGYTLLVGAPASALRAALLWTAVRGGRAAGREVRPFAAWGLAGLLLHLADPRAAHDPGFQLSFGAVLGLLAAGGLGGDATAAATGPLRRVVGWLRGAGAIALQSAGATAGTAGIGARLFGALPVAGFFLNVAVVPLCGVFMAEAFLFLGADLLQLAPLRDAAAGALDASGLLLLAANAWGAGLAAPWPLRSVPAPLTIAASAALLLLGAALRESARHETPRTAQLLRRTALLAALGAGVLPLTPWPVARARGEAPAVVAIDVGQGDALLARGGDGAVLLVDAGPADDARDAGRLAVEPALRAEGVTRVGTALLSHGHSDHFGGLGWLARRGWIATLLENGGERSAWRRSLDADLTRGGGRRVVVARDTTLQGAAPLSVWAPPADSLVRSRGNAVENNRSLVATLTLGGARLFLPGDAEDEAERAMLARRPDMEGSPGHIERVDILKAPHHGSRTSSTREWVEALRPRIVLVSCGERNRFGHPSRATMGRYRLVGARIWRTDQEGSIRVTIVEPGEKAEGVERGGRGAWVSTRAHPEPQWVALDSLRHR